MGAEALLARLEAVIRACGPSITAYSGGVDSTLVAAMAARVHGERALAVTAASPSIAPEELEQARTLARELGLAHRVIATGEMERPGYRANGPDRCYHCKSELFDSLGALAEEEGFAAVLSGANLDDLGDYRPGLLAGRERAVKQPLVDAGLRKADVRAVAAHLGLPNHDKPAAPCLASRIPYGTAVDRDSLGRIAAAEAALRALGFPIQRVRHHGDLARIELPALELRRALGARDEVLEAVRSAGYRWVALDLAGFRSGSLNDALDAETRAAGAGAGRR